MSGLVRMAIDRYVNLVDSISVKKLFFVSNTHLICFSVADPRVNNWPLMDSPIPTLVFVAIYLYIVLIAGPRFMANRKPFQLNKVLVIYNFIQVIFSTLMLWEHLMGGWLLEYSYKCQPVDYSNNPTAVRMANLCWWYYLSKFTEFMDTFFFILRKKDNQVTLLHLYHHSVTPIETWICVKFIAGGHGTFSNLINNMVHIIMYFYYMVSAMGPQYQKYLWWKRHLTLLQLVKQLPFILAFLYFYNNNNLFISFNNL
ncbi:Elongation of very long chain fatty acids protein 7 [Blattella germanica]|nr:Elongation of very long chain fatty acids protein 7 [Blattella germanica]